MLQKDLILRKSSLTNLLLVNPGNRREGCSTKGPFYIYLDPFRVPLIIILYFGIFRVFMF